MQPLIVVLALLIGVVAGLRTMTAPAAVSWAASLGVLPLDHTALAFLGFTATPWILTLLALAEHVTDQLEATPSRTVPLQFGARLVSGALSGAAVGAAAESMIVGAVAGMTGAVIGTFGGSAARRRLAAVFGKDPPAALVEDVVANLGALLVVVALK